jgi:lipid II:glycine glycyltransferase (peptidoglycan interpeptide bridge formation enzyme)
MEIQQTPQYAQYIKNLKWVVETIDGAYIYIKPFPLIGGIAKLQRVDHLPPVKNIVPILKKYKIRTFAVEVDCSMDQQAFTSWLTTMQQHVRINTDYFLPTKTIRVDLMASEDQIFSRFSEAKRRAVRRAQKNNLIIEKSNDIDAFLHVKNKSAGMFGFITTYGIKTLWQTLDPENKALVLCFSPTKKILGGIMILYHHDIAFYWIAGAVKDGKKLFAPTLLVWEGMKIAKSHGAKQFDFAGIWDERLPKKNPEWHGFTKFKEGFGGNDVYYPLVITS